MAKGSNRMKANPHILSAELRNPRRALNHLDILRDRIQSIEAGGKRLPGKLAVLEFHPSGECNLACFYCTYAGLLDARNSRVGCFPFEHLDKVVALSPTAIVISGGGEPTLYEDDGRTLQDVIEYLRHWLPETRMGLATNGVCVPAGEWPQELDWVRVSVDAATRQTFQMLKLGDIEQSLASVAAYLRACPGHVGVGYVYNRFNVLEIPSFIQIVYRRLAQEVGTQELKRVNMQFRPTCMIESCNCPSARYRQAGALMTPDLHDHWREWIAAIEEGLSSRSIGVPAEFVESRTNVRKILAPERPEPAEFLKCYASLLRWILRPNGEVYPCVLKCANSGACLGNLIEQDLGVVQGSAADCYSLSANSCEGARACCRFYGLTNELLERGLQGQILPPETTDPFF